MDNSQIITAYLHSLIETLILNEKPELTPWHKLFIKCLNQIFFFWVTKSFFFFHFFHSTFFPSFLLLCTLLFTNRNGFWWMYYLSCCQTVDNGSWWQSFIDTTVLNGKIFNRNMFDFIKDWSRQSNELFCHQTLLE